MTNKLLRYCLVMVSIFLVSAPIFAADHALIIDAGSSGTRVHVYEYTNNLSSTPVIHETFAKSVQPGLSSYAPTGDGAGASLKPILDASVADLTAHGIDPAQVSIRIFATAGMRLLPLDQQQAIYQDVRDYVHANYSFQLEDEDVRTISGVMEGVYGWLDVNYLQNNFENHSKTVGTIDMGGASTQIAFVSNETNLPENIVEVVINHKSYRIFSQSFLGLGMSRTVQAMTSDANAASCYPLDYAYNSTSSGNFSFSACSGVYDSIINGYDVTKHIASTTGMQFVAFSGIYTIYNFFNVLEAPTHDALQKQINEVCYLPWSTLLGNYSTTPAAYLSVECANAVYFDDLLYKGYQLKDSQLTVKDKIDGKGIDWTLGALLYSLIS